MADRKITITEAELDVKIRKTYIRAINFDGSHPNTAVALGYALASHGSELRETGEPYIIHPLTMACRALAIYLNEDELIAAILLHDVAEDNNKAITELPVNDIVRRAVEYLTIRPRRNESKLETKRRYFDILGSSITDPELHGIPLLVKGLDRFDNLRTMGKLKSSPERLRKNLYETQYFLLPLLHKGKSLLPQYSNQFQEITETLTALVDSQADLLGIVFSDEIPSDDELAKILDSKKS
ncbi:MAG: HD domain-containing protein [Candidatus Saccharibacteria bacterium]|nr:HD domain-containing protein [Candidatus Saccharibacteria bacterium]